MPKKNKEQDSLESDPERIGLLYLRQAIELS